MKKFIDWEEKLYSSGKKLNHEALIQVLNNFSDKAKEIAVQLLENNFSQKNLEEMDMKGIRYFFDKKNNFEIFVSCYGQKILGYEEVFSKKKLKMEKRGREVTVYEGREYRYFGNCKF